MTALLPQTAKRNHLLMPGDHLSLEEFARRWDNMPQLKRAELIGGIVYMSPPVGLEHGEGHITAGCWIASYAANVPACQRGCEASIILSEKDWPQPDVFLRLRNEFGGKSQVEGMYLKGPVELLVEVSFSTASYDNFEKKALYAKSGVQEYIIVLLNEGKVLWHVLENGEYKTILPSGDGLLRSKIFPGLWLDPIALLNNDVPRLIEVVSLGKKSPEFIEFAARKPQDSSK